ncbi:MAG: NAD(P)H-hydrate dehydratase, partial [Spirosomataceae bacterium]
LQQVKVPLVLDADGLNLLAENPSLLPYLQENTILTPHPKEFQRLVGACEDGFDMLRKAQDFSKKHKVIICLKGAHTAVVLPNGNVYFNTTGNPGMATAGSGDVLTGVILGLLSQGYAPDIAARLAVFKHGEAGDFAAARKSGTSLIASDLIEYLFW